MKEIRKCIWKTRTKKRTKRLSINELISEMINDEYDTIIEECTRHKNKPLFVVTPTKSELKTIFMLLIVPAFLGLFKNAMLMGMTVAFRLGKEVIGYIYKYRNRLHKYESRVK